MVPRRQHVGGLVRPGGLRRPLGGHRHPAWPTRCATPQPRRRLRDADPVPRRRQQRHHARDHHRPSTTRTARPARSTPCRSSSTSTGVVPNESPAGWGTLGGAGPQGQNWGFQELEAQAVAVRSYVMASPGSYGGYADTCDLACQTYRGTLNESAITDLAAADTAGPGHGVPQRRHRRHPVLGVHRWLHQSGGLPRRGRRRRLGLRPGGVQPQPQLDDLRPGVDHRRHLAPARRAAVHQHHRSQRATATGAAGSRP